MTSRWRSSYAAGVDYDDIVATLEREGIEKFRVSYAQLLEEIVRERQQS
jgi:transaldolase